MAAAIRILYFAQAARLTGCANEVVEYEQGLNLARLRETVLRRHPSLADIASSLRWAVAEQIAEADAPLSPGDTVAVLPPFSGG